LIAVGAALAGCGDGVSAQPARGEAVAERVAVRWLKAMGHGEIRAACQLMDAENHSSHPEHPNWSHAEDCRRRWLHSDNTPLDWKSKPGVISIWGIRDPEVLEVVVEGGRATVFVAGAGMKRPVWLVSEGGHWRVEGAEYPI
jgi:hypothetical protein